MSLFVASLNSGSNANCYYIGNSEDAVLIDAGLSCRETEKRMKRLGLSMHLVKAIFISHEHTDHIAGVHGILKKWSIPVYITQPTLRNATGLQVTDELQYSFADNTAITIGTLTIMPFTKKHDAADPYSFTISCNGITIGVFTDIGFACKNVIHHFKQCHAAFLETNYDEDMLMKGSYPVRLKKRISDGYGHLSNDEALQLFLDHRPAFMSHLFLSHLSQNNNHPDIAAQLFAPHAGQTKVVVASRYRETELFFINGDNANQTGSLQNKTAPIKKPVQLSLFE